LYAAHPPDGLELDDLSILGPIFVLKLKFTPDGYDRRVVAELWLYPDNSMILELSTKCTSEGARSERGSESVSVRTRHRPQRRAGDQNEESPGVLLGAAAS
jgi:nitric oxide reductase activation protein